MVHPTGPWPSVQSVGASVEPVAVGLHTCQKTVVAETPVTVAPNCTEVFTRTVMGDAWLLLMVIPTTVAFDEQPAMAMARSIVAPSAHTLMCFPPTLSTAIPPFNKPR
jgi:hypothetical protein